ncbi:hypothetical protein DdX_03496 [Ditylenchus destructor]|uniref:Uncharacterized protein n=1 Tax=Ditylenchus destructor TaxID=166010 RepID=A0AAD4RB29_9BILA|nr:hypothetical protein DdX_03496 [Ditylenchus destructor]
MHGDNVLRLCIFLIFSDYLTASAQIIYDSPPVGVSLTRPVLPWLARYFVGAGNSETHFLDEPQRGPSEGGEEEGGNDEGESEKEGDDKSKEAPNGGGSSSEESKDEGSKKGIKPIFLGPCRPPIMPAFRPQKSPEGPEKSNSYPAQVPVPVCPCGGYYPPMPAPIPICPQVPYPPQPPSAAGPAPLPVGVGYGAPPPEPYPVCPPPVPNNMCCCPGGCPPPAYDVPPPQFLPPAPLSANPPPSIPIPQQPLALLAPGELAPVSSNYLYSNVVLKGAPPPTPAAAKMRRHKIVFLTPPSHNPQKNQIGSHPVTMIQTKPIQLIKATNG